MARKRWRPDARPGELNLTAMIDVAFQLLSFFLITVKPVDVLAHLSAFRPSPEPPINQKPPNLDVIKIMIMPGFYVLNEKGISQEALERRLQSYAASDQGQVVLIMCAQKSMHEQLVTLLDLCAKYKLTNLSVVSSGGI